MAGNADSINGPSYEEAIIWEQKSVDPTEPFQQQYVDGKGLVILEDGVVRAVGEGRDNVWQPPVDDRDVDNPPGSPGTGYRVIVGSSPTGDFVGHVGELAHWNGTVWVFAAPKEGTVVYVKDESEPYKQTASSSPWIWALVNTTGGGALPPATEVGQFLFSYNGTTFEIVKPIVADDGFIVTDDDGHIVVTETP